MEYITENKMNFLLWVAVKKKKKKERPWVKGLRNRLMN